MTDLLQTLAQKLQVSKLAADLSSTANTVKKQSLEKLDLVTREEFDAQKALLTASEARVRELEQKLAALEKQIE